MHEVLANSITSHELENGSEDVTWQKVHLTVLCL